MDLILGFAEVGFFLGCAHTFKNWHKRQAVLQDLIEFVQKKSPISPSVLQKCMEVGAQDVLARGIKEYQQEDSFARGLALVKGVVQSDYSIRSLLNHSTELVHSAVSLEQMFSNSKHFENIDGPKVVQRVSEFMVVDQLHPTAVVTVCNHTNVRSADAMHQVHSIQFTRSLTPVEQVLNWVLFCFRLFLSMSNVNKRLSGFKVGTRRIERGILVGQFIVVFGEVVYDKFSKQLRMDNPVYFMKTKEQLLQYLREKNTQLGRNMTLVMTLLVLLGVLLVRRVIKTGKAVVEWYLKYRQRRKLDPFHRVRHLQLSDFRCVLCREHPRNVIFKPCLHLAVCSLCESKLDEQTCVVCRRDVDSSLAIYSA
jgi:Zinc finger, C3HC4 type (RING finger)